MQKWFLLIQLCAWTLSASQYLPKYGDTTEDFFQWAFYK